MSTHSCRFYHCTIVKRHSCRKLHNTVLRNDEIVLSCSVRLEGLHTEFLAHIVLATAARTALTADKLRAGGGIVSRLDRRYGSAYSNHFRRVFVTLHDRIEGCRMKTVVGMDLASADTDTFHIEKDLVVLQVCRSEVRDISEFELLGLEKYCLSHNDFIYVVCRQGR